MKTKMKKEYLNAILIISSFFIGCIVGISAWNITISRNDLTKTIKKVEDGVVFISESNGLENESLGSGFIYKKKGKKAYILTNYHVVEGKNISITNSKKETTTGKILGVDQKLDLAVIEIDKKYAPKELKLGNSKHVKKGEEMFAIGTPLSDRYINTVTKGMISGLDRTVPTTTDSSEEPLYDGIQFDASVNPGNSGGPIFNTKGEVIGICTMKIILLEVEGLGFAIPINQVKEQLSSLEKGEYIKHPELGITMVASSEKEVLQDYNIELETDKQGIVILDVKESSNAEEKLLTGDLITKINQTKITETDDVKEILAKNKIGDTIHITVIRDGKEQIIDIELK